MASTGSNSSVQDADVAAVARRHRRRADELQRRRARSVRSPARCGTAWRGTSRRAPCDSCSPTPDPPTARAKRRVRSWDLPRSWRWSTSAGRRSRELPYHGHPRSRRGVAGDSADGAAPGRQGLRRHRRGPSRRGTRLDRTTHRAGADRRVRLRLAVLRPPRQRRGDHQGHRLSDVQGAVRRAAAPAGRQRVRLLRASGRRTTWNRTSGRSSRRRSGSTSGWPWPRRAGEFRTCEAALGTRGAASRGDAGRSEHDARAGRGRAVRGPRASRRRLAARQGVGRDPGLRRRSGDRSGGAAAERRRADGIVPARIPRAPRDLDVGASAPDDRRAAQADRDARPIGFGSTIGCGRASSTTLRSATASASCPATTCCAR